MAKFILPESVKQRTQVILEKFPFVDGVFNTNNSYAQKVKLQLCRDYGCTLELDTEMNEDKVQLDETSLASNVTKVETTAEVKVEVKEETKEKPVAVPKAK